MPFISCKRNYYNFFEVLPSPCGVSAFDLSGWKTYNMGMLGVESKGGLAAVKPPSPALLGWKEIAEAFEPFRQQVALRLDAQTEAFEPQIAVFARYALTAQGKQLRPMLVALAGESVGKWTDSHLTAAVIIEMVHLATLVHDDVIDEARLRRGRPTMKANWGNEVSVLLGDCLFAHALKLAASFPTPEVCRAVAAATNTVCAGEILQNRSRGDFNITLEHYYKMVAMKTGELFAVSCDLGAFLNQTTPQRREALRRYGMALGTAYQIYDDCLDLLGTESNAGKTLGADLARGKLTLPTLIVRDRATPADSALLQSWLAQWEPHFLPEVAELIEKYDAFAESRTVIQNYLDEARQALEILPDTSGRARLFGLTEFLTEQTDALGVAYK